MRFGKPLDFSRYAGMENDRYILRSITDEIMYELMLLSRQEYVDVYAATMKERLAAAKKHGGGWEVPDDAQPAVSAPRVVRAVQSAPDDAA